MSWSWSDGDQDKSICTSKIAFYIVCLICKYSNFSSWLESRVFNPFCLCRQNFDGIILFFWLNWCAYPVVEITLMLLMINEIILFSCFDIFIFFFIFTYHGPLDLPLGVRSSFWFCAFFTPDSMDMDCIYTLMSMSIIKGRRLSKIWWFFYY